MKFTPGPWQVTPYLIPERDDDPMGVYKVEPAFGLLTERYFGCTPDLDDDVSKEEYDDAYEKEAEALELIHGENASNAQLIAATPDLLDALIALEGSLDKWESQICAEHVDRESECPLCNARKLLKSLSDIIK